MLAFLRSPIGRWVVLTLLLPVIAALLSRLGRAVQRRSGHPTRTSKALLTFSRLADRRNGGDAELDVTEPPSDKNLTGTAHASSRQV
jgi:hypothetical protein